MNTAPAPDYLTLHSPACSVVLELVGKDAVDRAPLWRYWGPRLPDGFTPGPPLRSTRPEPSFSLHHDQPLSIFPGLGTAWFGPSALLAHRDGPEGACDWTLAFDGCTVERADAHAATLHLTDSVARIAVTVVLTLDPATDTLTLTTTLTNVGDAPLQVQFLAAATLPLPPDAAHIDSFTGRHNAEFVPLRDALSRNVWRRENRRGLTGHDGFPGAIVEAADGTAYGAQLAWSGNSVQQIAWVEDGRFVWQWGEGLAPGELQLGAGESVTAPEVLATCSADGVNGVTHAFHRAIRARLDWPGGAMRRRPVHLNTWEGFYFDHDEAALKDLATAAARLGVERFVLDDGWFGASALGPSRARDNDTSSLGDWAPDPVKYPAGLAPLAAHVTGLGMEFGLWVEPEMVNPDSALYRAHPDWALHVAGRPRLAARNQLVLDMHRADVRDYLFDAIAALLETLPITYLKWDHNRDLTHAAGAGHPGPLYRQQVLGAYALFDRLRAAFPMLEIEACAGGGGRIDAGIAARTHRFWTSDCIDAIERVRIQRGFLRYMPPEMMGSHVGACPAHSTGRMQSMAFRAGVALPGHFGVELDARHLGEGEAAELSAAIARYKRLRDRLHQGRVWLGEAQDGIVWQAHGDAAHLLLLITRQRPTTQRHAPHLRLPMLAADTRYHLRGEGGDACPLDGAVLDGAWLARVGAPLPPMAGEQVLVWEIDAI